jgi:hypothetical protein
VIKILLSFLLCSIIAAPSFAQMTRDEAKAAAMVEMLREQKQKEDRAAIDRERARIKSEIEASRDTWNGTKTEDSSGSFGVSLVVSGVLVGIISIFSWGSRRNKIIVTTLATCAAGAFLLSFLNQELDRYTTDWFAAAIGFFIAPSIAFYFLLNAEDS